MFKEAGLGYLNTSDVAVRVAAGLPIVQLFQMVIVKIMRYCNVGKSVEWCD